MTAFFPFVASSLRRSVAFLTICYLLFAICLSSVCICAPSVAKSPSYDLVIVGGTPGGVAMAVRSAREGLNVLLVNHTQHLGGLLSNGLSVWDTQYEGKRSPIYDELRQSIFDYYREKYGADSPHYRNALPGKSGHTNGRFEAHVAEKLIDQLVARESRITVLKGFDPISAERDGAILRSLTLRSATQTLHVSAPIFADCTYEGDLLALAKAPYRVGRESRAEFNEPHAGHIFMRFTKNLGERENALIAAHDRLNLRRFAGWQEIAPESSGEADAAVQAFNYRTVLSSDPANRLIPDRPRDYNPDRARSLEFGSIVHPLPNNKIGWNRPQLVGPHHAYVEGDGTKRQQVLDQHWNATLELLYFLQNDPSVPAEKRKYWQQYGLAKDEFTDNGHRPWEIYVREARRLVGRFVFTQHDAMLAPNLGRAPIPGDSVGITEWYMDTHACTPGKLPGYLDEGKMMLHYLTFPGQVSYRCLLPKDLDNLLVPVCLSSTHVSWGTIRLEPTWMNIGESAAYAAVLAVTRKCTPAAIDTDALLRTLAERRVMIAFFNDIDIAAKATWIPAIQYFGAKGFFPDYDARPDQPLTRSVATHWARMLGLLARNQLDPLAEARALHAAPADAKPVTHSEFMQMLVRHVPQAGRDLRLDPNAVLQRGQACELMYQLLETK